MERPATDILATKAAIRSHIRGEIVEGKLAPGVKLPSRRVLAKQFRTTLVTLQRAMDALAGDGFLDARGPAGTFVVDNPPHLCRYGVVFARQESSAEFWPRFWHVVRDEAGRLHRPNERELAIFYDDGGHTDSAEYQRLLSDVERHRVAGLIFTHDVVGLASSPLLKVPGIPRVAMMEPAASVAIPAVAMEVESFVRLSLDYLASRGRKRLAILCVANQLGQREAVLAAAAARQMITRPYWVHELPLPAERVSQSVVHLLFSGEACVRPDALLIMDDNLVPAAMKGLVAAGVSAPADLDVVAHANFPEMLPTPFPVWRVGFSIRQVLNTCMDSIDRQRRGAAFAMVTRLPAISQDDEDVFEGFGT